MGRIESGQWTVDLSMMLLFGAAREDMGPRRDGRT